MQYPLDSTVMPARGLKKDMWGPLGVAWEYPSFILPDASTKNSSQVQEDTWFGAAVLYALWLAAFQFNKLFLSGLLGRLKSSEHTELVS
eukprot:2112934-Amphidinium_carterae.1